MEEKKQQVEKLSYEELENAAQQMSVQAKALYEENLKLKEALDQTEVANAYTQLNFRFKVLENYAHFSPEFIEDNIKAIERMMTYKEEKKDEEQGD